MPPVLPLFPEFCEQKYVAFPVLTTLLVGPVPKYDFGGAWAIVMVCFGLLLLTAVYVASKVTLLC